MPWLVRPSELALSIAKQTAPLRPQERTFCARGRLQVLGISKSVRNYRQMPGLRSSAMCLRIGTRLGARKSVKKFRPIQGLIVFSALTGDEFSPETTEVRHSAVVASSLEALWLGACPLRRARGSRNRYDARAQHAPPPALAKGLAGTTREPSGQPRILRCM